MLFDLAFQKNANKKIIDENQQNISEKCVGIYTKGITIGLTWYKH